MSFDERPLIIAGMPHPSEGALREAIEDSGCVLELPADEVGTRDSPTDGKSPFTVLHDQLLQREEDELQPWLVDGSRSTGRFTTAASELIGRFSCASTPWGWVDARTTLFLEFWDDLLPEARWIFLFSRPSLFAWTLIADDRLRELTAVPVRQALTAFTAWREYGARLQAFVADRPDRCFLLEVPGGLARSAPALNAALKDWGYALDPIHPSALSPRCLYIERAPSWVRWCEAASAPTLRAWRSLRDLAERRESAGRATTTSPSASTSGGGRGGRRVCVAGWNRQAYSQTFVLAHVNRLPVQTTVLVKRGRRYVTRDEFRVGSVPERIIEAILREFRVDPQLVVDRSLSRFLRRERVDAVLVEFGPNGAKLWRACRRAGVPLVVHFHGFDAHSEATLEEYASEYARMFENVAAIIAVSSVMRRKLIDMGAPPELVHLNPCGVDVSDFPPADPGRAPPTFLAVGRFVSKKGPLLTILSFRDVLDAVPDARLLMVGEGPLLDGCRQVADGLGLRDHVRFLGSRPHRQVARLMREARAFVQHSLVADDGDSEGTPVAVLEAGATGIPVVVTRHAGIAEAVIHGRTGYLVDERDVSAMSAYLKDLARDPELASTLGARARDHVSRHHSMAIHIEKLWGVIERAIEAKGAEGGLA